MMDAKHQQTKDAIRAELASTRSTLHTLLDSLSENDLRRKSHNSGWTNGEILAHVLFGFVILNPLLPMGRLGGRMPKWASRLFAWLLNAFTGPFNWVNALGARLQGRVFTYRRIGNLYDGVYISLLRQLNSIQENEWERGMYYPTRWDSNFSDFMTVEKLCHYPVVHFNFHMRQITR